MDLEASGRGIERDRNDKATSSSTIQQRLHVRQPLPFYVVNGSTLEDDSLKDAMKGKLDLEREIRAVRAQMAKLELRFNERSTKVVSSTSETDAPPVYTDVPTQ